MARSATAGNATTAALLSALPGTAVPLREEVPFSSARRWSAVASDRSPLAGAYVLGAVDALLPALADPAAADGVLPAVRERTDRGMRVLLLARAVDPPRGCPTRRPGSRCCRGCDRWRSWCSATSCARSSRTACAT